MDCIEYWDLLADHRSAEDLTASAQEWTDHDRECSSCQAAVSRNRAQRLIQQGARIHCKRVLELSSRDVT